VDNQSVVKSVKLKPKDMKLLSRLIVVLITNIIGLFLAAYFVKGFYINPDVITYIKLGVVFSALNIFIRPVLKLVFTPILLITFGLGIIVVNAIILYLLYKIYPVGISIDMATSGLYPLVYATLVISAVHFIIGFASKRAYK
jgi:putative membrane protein